jgi:outer membrane protein insertion porin family
MLSVAEMRVSGLLAAIVITSIATGGLAHAGDLHVVFSGNDHAPAASLRAAMTRPLHPDIAGFDQDALDIDTLLVQAYYWNRGYPLMRVATPRYDPSTRTISIAVHEGPMIHVGALHVTGELVRSEGELLAMLSVQAGERWSGSRIADAGEALTTFYEDRGYARVDVHQVERRDIARGRIDVDFEIRHGKRVRIEHVVLDNHTTIPDAEVWRLVVVAPGQWFTASALEQTKHRLEATGRFKSVNVTTHGGSTDERIDVGIEVTDR